MFKLFQVGTPSPPECSIECVATGNTVNHEKPFTVRVIFSRSHCLLLKGHGVEWSQGFFPWKAGAWCDVRGSMNSAPCADPLVPFMVDICRSLTTVL